MLVLAVESSTQVASVALSDGAKILGELSSDQPKSHSEFINPAIEKLLLQSGKKVSDIDLFAVDIGPGSFTGVRVAVNVIRTFAYVQEKPVFARHSLHLLQDQTAKSCLALINAYKNMIFISLRSEDGSSTAPEVIPAEGLEDRLQGLDSILCVGDGYGAYASLFSPVLLKKLSRDSQLSDHPSASILSQQAQLPEAQTLDWKSIIPLYLRGSAAEESLKPQKS